MCVEAEVPSLHGPADLITCRSKWASDAPTDCRTSQSNSDLDLSTHRYRNSEIRHLGCS